LTGGNGSLRLLPLGTNGFIPAAGRQTMSILVERGGEALVLDAGTGLARLLEPAAAETLARIERLDIVLTHYHLDHVVGLSYLPGVTPDRGVRIFAPAPPLTASGPEALATLISPPLFPVTFDRWPMPVEIVPYSGPELVIGGFRIAVRGQRHPGGSAGLRIGDDLAYVTDTVLDPATEEFVRGVGLLLHEVWLTDEEAAVEDAGRRGHSAAGPVAELARRAGVGALVPIHHHPRRSSAEVAALGARLGRGSDLVVLSAIEGRWLPER
jgi:ribonuclease BN (tRNA processing enzyme)